MSREYTHAERYLSGITERLAEDADRDLKERIRLVLEALGQELYRRYEQPNREEAYDRFMREQDELRIWARLRAQEMLDKGEAAGPAARAECERVLKGGGR